jgi:peptide/nickel transport system ATP-binding protein
MTRAEPVERAMAASPLLSVEGLGVAIDGRELLRDVAFELGAGEVLGLVGESGSGKSMTALALARLLPRHATLTGSVRLAGAELTSLDESALCRVRGRDVGLVFQEPASALNPLHTIGAQVAETVRIHRRVPRAEALATAARVLERVGLPPDRVPLDRFPHELSGGQRQRVAIALAVALTPKLLVADEPTTALDVTTQARILELLRDLARETGMALVLVSHDLAVVATLADRIAILRDGAVVEQGPAASVLRRPTDPYARALVRNARPSTVLSGTAGAGTSGTRDVATGGPLLVADALVRDYPARAAPRGTPPLRAVDGVSLSIAAGERVGLVGESGSGKSTFVRMLLGLDAPTAGRVLVDGVALHGARGAEQRRLRRLLQVVFQDPYASLNPRHRVERIVAEPLYLLDRAPPAAERRRWVERLLDDVGLEPDHADRYPHEFSGGQRQRIAIARALAVDPRVVVLDEAVSALDATLRTQVLELLERLRAQRGLAYLFVSHDLEVVRAVTDRVLVMQHGRIVEQGPTARVLDAPEHPYTRTLVAASPSIERALAARGMAAGEPG